MLYRMVEYGNNPKIKVVAESEDMGTVPIFNTIATIPGSEKPNEYIVLSAHIDSWDGGTGRVVSISGQEFLHAYGYVGSWPEKRDANRGEDFK